MGYQMSLRVVIIGNDTNEQNQSTLLCTGLKG